MKYIRYILGRLLGMSGGLVILSGICSPLYSDSSQIEPSGVVWLIIFGSFLIFCAVLLLKLPIVERRPPFWFPAISGLLSSCFVLLFTLWLVIKWADPTAR